jgi:hypothetical protein
MFRFDELDFVAVWIFNEGDDRGTTFNRACFTHHFAACFANVFTGLRNVVNAQRQMAECGAVVVALYAIVIGQFAPSLSSS